MKIILLSGGSGKRLWPLSNDARSKQFLRLLTSPSGEKESMIQRVVRQIGDAGLADEIVVATGASQRESIENQLGDRLSVVTEPCRRDTFPAIVLACSYLASKGTPMDEPVIVMPCDSYTEDAYFEVIGRMSRAVVDGAADLVLMGIEPTYPSAKYGYIVPEPGSDGQGLRHVKCFREKPDVPVAEELIAEGALWNGGVFAFRLGYLMDIASRVLPGMDFETMRENYGRLPKISFDYQVVEKADSVAVMPYAGQWKDLGTWNTLTDELDESTYGNVLTENCSGSYVINELEVPLVCIGARNLVVAASPDGVLVSERSQSENLKHLVDGLRRMPMYEERRWGEVKIVDYIEFPDGTYALTKQIKVTPGSAISYQRHQYRDEIWTVVCGEGEIVLDGQRMSVVPGNVFTIRKGTLHGIRATTPLTFMEVQRGDDVERDDVEHFEYTW